MTFSKECEPVFLPVYQLCEHFNRPDNVDLTKTLYCHIYTKKCHVTTFFGLVVCFRICKIFFLCKKCAAKIEKEKKRREGKKKTNKRKLSVLCHECYIRPWSSSEPWLHSRTAPHPLVQSLNECPYRVAVK